MTVGVFRGRASDALEQVPVHQFIRSGEEALDPAGRTAVYASKQAKVGRIKGW